MGNRAEKRAKVDGNSVKKSTKSRGENMRKYKGNNNEKRVEKLVKIEAEKDESWCKCNKLILVDLL